MTNRQRLHFIWLTLMSAARISTNADRESASRIIRQASDKRAKLGLPLHKINDSQKVKQMVFVLVKISPLPLLIPALNDQGICIETEDTTDLESPF